MRLIFEAGTDSASYSIFDVQTAEALAAKGVNLVDVIEDAYAGVLNYSNASDGACTAHVFVDEDPPEDYLRCASGRVDGMPLPMPSGRLLFCGSEDLVEGPWSTARAIPPGLYRVTGFDLHWQAELLSDERRVLFDKYERAKWAGPLGCLLVLCCAGSGFGWGVVTAYREFFGWIFLLSGLLLLIWLTDDPSIRKLRETQRNAKREFPDVALVFTRVREGESYDTAGPTAFGSTNALPG